MSRNNETFSPALATPISAGDALEALDLALEKCGIKRHFGATDVNRWIISALGEKEAVDWPLGILYEFSAGKEGAQSVLDAALALWNARATERLKKLPPHQKQAAEEQQGASIGMTRYGHELRAIAGEAMSLMGSSPLSAKETFERLFTIALQEKRTDSDIFRAFGNAGLAAFAAGDEALGRRLFQCALELAPSYAYAREQLEFYEDGAFDEMIENGRIRAAGESLEKTRSIIPKDPEDMPREELEELLAEYGIGVPQSKQVQARVLAGATLNDLLADFDTELEKRDDLSAVADDALRFAHLALIRQYVADIPHDDTIRDAVRDLDDIFEDTGAANSAKSAGVFKQLEDLAASPHVERFTESTRTGGEQNDLARLAITSVPFLVSPFRSRVLRIFETLHKRTPHDWYEFVLVADLFLGNDPQWSRQADVLFRRMKVPEPVLAIASLLADHPDTQRRDEAGTYYELALDIVRERVARDDREMPGFTVLSGESLMDAIEQTFKEAMSYYKRRGDKAKASALHKELREYRERAEYLSSSKVGEALLRGMERLEEERVEAHPAISYFAWLKTLGINFDSPAAEHFEATFIRAGGRGPKIGRNEPCPCGSGKKYKKCHG